MKVNKCYEIENVLDSYVLINVFNNDNSIIKLNETSKDIFDLVSDDKNIDEIVNILTKKYDVDRDILYKDVNNFIDEMILKGIFING